MQPSSQSKRGFHKCYFNQSLLFQHIDRTWILIRSLKCCSNNNKLQIQPSCYCSHLYMHSFNIKYLCLWALLLLYTAVHTHQHMSVTEAVQPPHILYGDTTVTELRQLSKCFHTRQLRSPPALCNGFDSVTVDLCLLWNKPINMFTLWRWGSLSSPVKNTLTLIHLACFVAVWLHVASCSCPLQCWTPKFNRGSPQWEQLTVQMHADVGLEVKVSTKVRRKQIENVTAENKWPNFSRSKGAYQMRTWSSLLSGADLNHGIYVNVHLLMCIYIFMCSIFYLKADGESDCWHICWLWNCTFNLSLLHQARPCHISAYALIEAPLAIISSKLKI